jgi:hypothetical protein
MPTGYFLPTDDSGKADLLDHLAATLPKYAELFALSAEVISARQADALAFRHAQHCSDDMQAYAQHTTAHKNLLRDGGDGSGDWPLPPTLNQPVPAPVAPGIIPRLTSFVSWLKAQPKYTEAIGQDLWLVGAKQVIDPTTWKPIPAIQTLGGHPVIAWTKGKATALEIWVDRNDGNGFVLLTISTSPPTTDNSPLPAPGASAVWKYKAIYRQRDDQVGQWSDVVSVTVGG